MATIKLQPSGKVLIKDGKVSCGCCEVCGCAVSIPQELRELVANATAESLSLNGFFANPEDFFRTGDDSWDAFIFGDGGGEVHYFNGCLSFEVPLYRTVMTSRSLAETGDPDQCAYLGGATVTGTFSINGITGFNYFYYTDNGQTPVPPPVIIFT